MNHDDGGRGDDSAVRELLRRAPRRGLRLPRAAARAARPPRTRSRRRSSARCARTHASSTGGICARGSSRSPRASRSTRPSGSASDGSRHLARSRRPRTRGRRISSWSTSRRSCRRRSAPPSCSATATTFPTRRSALRSARRPTRPGRRRRRAFAGCAGRRDSHEGHSGARLAASATRRPRRATSTSAYDMVDTPIGAIFVAATPAGLCRISYDPEPERVVENLARTVGVRVLRSPRAGGRDAPAARRVLRARAHGLRSRHRPARRRGLLAPRARRARARPVRRGDDVRRARPARRASARRACGRAR